MPYVEGFGTWPFGEEWLWEAMAVCYLPLVDLLDDGGPLEGAPITISLTPVLCDQLQAPGIAERFGRFVDEVRRHTHAEDARGLRAGGHETLARELERSWGDYERALESFRRRDGDLLGALARHAAWTSSATHAVLPLLATEAALRLQVRAGIDAHRARCGDRWRGGFWLPECAHAPWLEPTLADAGVHAVCVELTGRDLPVARAGCLDRPPPTQSRAAEQVRRWGSEHMRLGGSGHLRPLLSESGVVLVPVDRATIDLVWNDRGYPADGRYRDYHRHTVHHHNPWANDGDPYDHRRAVELAREHAADFVSRTRERLRRAGAGLPGGGLAVCALDTELLGHWWYEGLAWLTAVVAECDRQGLALVGLDDALERHEPALLGDLAGRAEPLPGRGGVPMTDWGALAVSTWGQGGDLSSWSGPAVADIAFATRAAELAVVRAGARAPDAAVRELLALQASDWAFMVSRGLAVPYARERLQGHRLGVERALAEGAGADASGLRDLAVHADRAALLAP